MTSNKIARILFILVGIIMPIFIGGLHMLAHFNDLLTPEIQNHLQKEISVMGENQVMYNTWGLISFMMGISFITIGVLNISIVTKLTKDGKVPLISFIAMIIYLLAVIYVGNTFNAAFQLYGGIFGLIVTIISLILNQKTVKN